MKEELRLCAKCANHIFYDRQHKCFRKEGEEINLVTGEIKTKYCETERAGPLSYGYCSLFGQFFKPVPPPTPEEVKEELEETKRKWYSWFFNIRRTEE